MPERHYAHAARRSRFEEARVAGEVGVGGESVRIVHPRRVAVTRTRCSALAVCALVLSPRVAVATRPRCGVSRCHARRRAVVCVVCKCRRNVGGNRTRPGMSPE